MVLLIFIYIAWNTRVPYTYLHVVPRYLSPVFTLLLSTTKRYTRHANRITFFSIPLYVLRSYLYEVCKKKDMSVFMFLVLLLFVYITRRCVYPERYVLPEKHVVY